MSRADLAREAGCGRTVITDLLNGEQLSSTYVPEIHKALKWPAPPSPMMSADELELIKIYRGLSPESRAAVKERAITKAEEITGKPIRKR